MVAPRHQDYYRERSQHFLNLFDDELERGELEVSCELLWGSAAHAIKSAAQQRRWRHGPHTLLGAAIDRLVENGAPAHLTGQYEIASAFHVGFYGDRQFSPEQLRLAKGLIAEFIQSGKFALTGAALCRHNGGRPQNRAPNLTARRHAVYTAALTNRRR